jgi:hypothetical protein
MRKALIYRNLDSSEVLIVHQLLINDEPKLSTIFKNNSLYNEPASLSFSLKLSHNIMGQQTSHPQPQGEQQQP